MEAVVVTDGRRGGRGDCSNSSGGGDRGSGDNKESGGNRRSNGNSSGVAINK